jgi:hypothetical protein
MSGFLRVLQVVIEFKHLLKKQIYLQKSLQAKLDAKKAKADAKKAAIEARLAKEAEEKAAQRSCCKG